MNKLKFLVFFGGLLLVWLHCTSGPMPLIGQVFCHYADTCGFLSLEGKLSGTQKLKIIRSSVYKDINPAPCAKKYELIIYLDILNKYINPYKYQKDVRSSFVTWRNILIDHRKSTLPSMGNCLPFQVLQIVGISIIKS